MTSMYNNSVSKQKIYIIMLDTLYVLGNKGNKYTRKEKDS